MPNEQLPEIHIFDAGTWYDNNGRKHVVTEAMLETIANDFNAANEEAPLTPDHPRDQSVDYGTLPAFAHFNKLRRDGKKMYAQISRMSDALKTVAKENIFTSVSAGFNAGFGKLTHVAALPSTKLAALPHLEPLSAYFSKQPSITEYYFAMADPTAATPTATPSTGATLDSILKAIQDLSAKFDKAEAEDVKEDAQEDLTKPSPSGFSAASPEFVAMQKKLAEQAEKIRRNEVAERLRPFVTDGKLTPAEFSDKVDVLMVLSSGANFSASDETTPYAKELKSIANRQSFDFSEQATHANSGSNTQGYNDLAESIVKTTNNRNK